MKISSDLDDTIISKSRFALEKEPLLGKLIGAERIRFGTIALFKQLKAKGYEVGIYTTSFRSKAKIRRMFWLYGISVDYIINQQEHDKVLREKSKNISKYPPAFGIDIHIDDLVGVEIEGKRHNFTTIIVPTDDDKWVDNILEEIDML